MRCRCEAESCRLIGVINFRDYWSWTRSAHRRLLTSVIQHVVLDTAFTRNW
jgi:hypothetical protein